MIQLSQREIFNLKGLLQTFSSTGLQVNFQKSCMVPINISQEEMPILAGTFGCTIEAMPFTYLGLPLGTTKPSVEDHAPIISKIERRLSSTSVFLALAGRVTYINSAVRSMPIYAMCTLKLHITVLDHLDKLCRATLWKGREMDARGKALVAWNKCTIPKETGGLGIKNIKLQNEALLLKHLDKFYNRMSHG